MTDITGWKLVPDDPTEAMWQAGRTADEAPGDSYSKVWRAMFDAAPDVDDCETTSLRQQLEQQRYENTKLYDDAKKRALELINTGDLFNMLISRIKYDGSDFASLTLGEIERATEGARLPQSSGLARTP